jgi:hypothetical protein
MKGADEAREANVPQTTQLREPDEVARPLLPTIQPNRPSDDSQMKMAGSGLQKSLFLWIFVLFLAMTGIFFFLGEVPSLLPQDVVFKNETFETKLDASTFAEEESSDESIAVLNMNPESTIASDVLGGWHNPKEGSIIIEFNRTGRCPRPVLRGRLSGPALGMLEWKYLSGNSTTVQGKYQVPFSGTYYLEIIVMLCHGWNRTTDFKDICLEDRAHHRVTELNTIIQVSRAQKGAHEMYWVSNATSTAIQPLYTRFQPPNCRNESQTDLERCSGSMDSSRFTPYSLQWDTDELKQKLGSINNSSKICLVGASHSKLMLGYMNRFVPNGTVAFPNGLGYKNRTTFPRYVTREFVEDLVNRLKCKKIVIGLGQWSAGWPEDEPTLFPAFETQMSTLLENIQDIGVEIFLRSLHYNPIGDMISACPPIDWRSPPVIDGYNRILKRVSKKFNVQFIDTNAIIGPFWDSPPDWCHFKNDAGVNDALYIAGRVLGLL